MPDISEPEDFSKVIRGQVTADPALGLPLGAELRFEAGLITTDLRGRASWLRNWQIFDGMLLSMHFGISDEHSVDGSAILVAPGIALCATHVIAPHLEALEQGKAGAICIGLASDGMRAWRVRAVTEVPRTDISIVALEYATQLPPSRIFYQATVSTRLPATGEHLTLCGFRLGAAGTGRDGLGLTFHGNVLLCRGEVTQLYPTGRDRHMMPWPSIEVDCPAWGGMSGGPVYDAKGFLVGLVCSSIEDGHPTGPAYVSLLWPALVQSFSGGWPPGLVSQPTRLLDLTSVCWIEGREAINQLPDGSWAVDQW